MKEVRMARIPFVLLVVVVAAMAGAQPLAGSWEGATDVGLAVVVFAQDGATLTGTLEAPGLAFAFEGEVEGGVGYGLVTTGQGTAGFEAHVQGDLLGLYLYEFDAAGGVAEGSVIELLLERVVAAAPAAPRPRTRPRDATLAQLVEHPICNRKVVGSIPMGGSKPRSRRERGTADRTNVGRCPSG